MNTFLEILKAPASSVTSVYPAFSTMQVEEIVPAVETVLNQNRKALARITTSQATPTWENTVQPLDEMEDRLSRVFSPIRHLNSVKSSDQWREAYERCLPLISAYETELGQNKSLYERFNALQADQQLDATQQKIIENALKAFKLSGIALPEAEQERYKVLVQELSDLSSQFENNVLQATMAWEKHITDPKELAGIPENSQAMFKQQAEAKSLSGYLINLQIPNYLAVMTYADDRDLRRACYTAYQTRASDQHDKGPQAASEFDNTQVMLDILNRRQALAQLLGFAHYADQSLATKMAEDGDQVVDFLNDLAQKARPQAERERQELQAFAAESGLDELQAWDLMYYSEKLQIEKYQISQEELKAWFPAESVLEGLFAIVSRLYNVIIEPVDGVDVWHPSVSYYRIQDKTSQQILGEFYVDLYARENKRGGAWMDVSQTRFRRGDQVQIPVAYLTCNSTPPVGDLPALFTHDEVITVFHEFGHGLHHMLTLIDYPAVSGIGGVEWDAVELPSQFMENWCWEKEALDLFARHYKTGKTLPEDKLQKLRASRNFQAAMQMLRQIEFSLFDFQLHQHFKQGQTSTDIQHLLNQIRAEIAVNPTPEFSRFQHSFSHIFAGGYAAGYYSYKWAEVLSADAFSRFEDEGIFNTDTGQRFKQTILEQGGSADAMQLFVRFMGRKPSNDALLRHYGLTEAA